MKQILYVTDEREKFEKLIEAASQDARFAAVEFTYVNILETKEKVRWSNYDIIFFAVTGSKAKADGKRLVVDIHEGFNGSIIWGSTEVSTKRDLQPVGVHYFCPSAADKFLCFLKGFLSE